MKTVLITGGSRGLGRELAVSLSEKGWAVAVNYHASENEALALSKSLKNAVAIKADVGDIRQVIEMERDIRKKWGRLDALINNAGITKDGLLLKTSEEDWDSVLRVNLKGCFNTIKTFAPLIAESGGGHIINISSRTGLRGKTGQAAYSASKAGLIGLTVSLAKELAPLNIRVNAILPGYMPTEMGAEAGEAMRRAKEQSLLGRLSEPGEIAGCILWLLSTWGVTGQVFVLDSRE
ncbi:MAG: SDR family NAD(P)-dependent oxidoreductase [Thermodesulfovibrionales bacterium]|nr:SDR family NAD(P)-dependent oxidoreductase [Thermodesulfovibrionales bacterium]